MSNAQTVHANGAIIPRIGLGTWQLQGEACVNAVATALKAGYRHIDTAVAYENEAEVGEGLRASALPRDEVFVTTKVWRTDMRADDVLRSAENSLKRLGLPQVDLLLIHWPNDEVPLRETMRGLCEAKRAGLTRHIGVSNFTIALINDAVRLADEPIVTNQCEYHPCLDQTNLIQAGREHGVSFTSYSPLGRGDLLNEPAIKAIAEAKNKTAAQVILRWHIQHPAVIAVPKSGHPDRIRDNIDIFNFQLSVMEMETISNLARQDGRMIAPSWSPRWD